MYVLVSGVGSKSLIALWIAWGVTPCISAICLYERLLFNLRDNAFDLSTLGLVGLFDGFTVSAVIWLLSTRYLVVWVISIQSSFACIKFLYH